MATITKKSFQMEDNEYLDAASVHIFTKDQTLEEFAGTKVNNKSLGSNVVLKSADFAESITGEKMLANLTYTVTATWT